MPLSLGDRNETVREWRWVMAARFPGYERTCGPLPTDTDQFGPRARSWQCEYERRTGQVVDGIVSDDDLRALGIKVPVRPVFFTVEGHMSDMYVGPCAFVAQTLEQEGRVWWRPTGYDNVSLPFNNQSGREELVRRVESESKPGVPIIFAGFSQGAQVLCEFMAKDLLDPKGRLHYRLPDFVKGIAFGNPNRLINQCAPWVPDPPEPDTQGIMDWHFDFTKYPELAGKWQEHSRTRDWYAENRLDEAGANMTAIAKIITTNSWIGGPASIVARIMDLFVNPFDGLIDIVWAIVRTFMGIAHLEAHGTYDLNPVLDWFRQDI